MRNAVNLILISLIFAVMIAAQTSWGLDRINQRFLPFDLDTTMPYTGAGVTVYVIDSGVINVPEFDGRVRQGYGRHDVNCSSHATGIAGIVGGSTYGVAKQVNIVSVKVYCSGDVTIDTPEKGLSLLKGLAWVYRDAKRNSRTSVAVIPLNGGRNLELDDAVRKLTTVNVVPVVSAGNGDQFGPKNACNYSPSAVLEALVVGGTRADDTALPYSNYGPCVDLYAPGEGVWTVWNTGELTWMSGTSYAAPHVAGVAAQYLELHPFASVAEVHQAVVNNATLLQFGLFVYVF